VLVVQGAGGVASSAQVPLGVRLANLPVNYVRYLAKLVWPTKLAIVYPLVRQWPLLVVLVCVVLVLALMAFAFFQGLRRPFLVIGLFWFLGMLVPVIGIVQAGSQSIADRFTYLPAIGLFMALTWSVAELTAKSRAARVFSASAA